MRIYVIGCGGVGSWLTPSLCMLKGANHVTVIDGDLLEEKNLNRQLYCAGEVGEKKAVALAMRTGCAAITDFYHIGTVDHAPEDWLLVAVDNNAARLAALQACDTYQCQAIIGANETTSSEAYIYRGIWRGGELDPRVYYPEINVDKGRDPIGCTGKAQEERPQLVTANFMAAALMQHLFVLWCDVVPLINADSIPRIPHRLVANQTKLETHRLWDKYQPKEEPKQRPAYSFEERVFEQWVTQQPIPYNPYETR